MAQIEVIRDPQIKQSDIVHALREPSKEGIETEQPSTSETQQTKVFGILVPLLALNQVAVDWNDVYEFTLDDTGKTPICTFRIKDRQSIFQNYSHLGNDNELRVQILPQFDNTYQKINLTFLVTDLSIQDDVVSGRGVYKLNKFTESRFKALGQITTFELADKISLDTGLGFGSNVRATEDRRYIQCSYESYKEVMGREINKSGATATQVYDWWVDCWNNLILCDLYDRINSEDSEEDMKIWVTNNTSQASAVSKPEPRLAPAIFSNHPAFEWTDVYTFDYDVDNQPITSTRGNSFAVSIYEENKKDCLDHYITDGDIVKNEFIKYEYLGEVYGDYNYLLAEKCRDVYLSKIKSEVVVIHTPMPQLGVMRGDQCRFVWYDNDAEQYMNQKTYEDAGVIATASDLSPQIGWLADWVSEHPTMDFPMQVNLQYSGQYTSIGQYISYDGDTQKWDCWLYLSRPASKRPKISQLEESAQNGQNIK